MKKDPGWYTTMAYVNHGRWVVECECRNAVEAVPAPAAHQIKVGQKRWQCAPPEGFGAAGFCGAQWTILWPGARDRITQILAHRPKANQNWDPKETVDMLVAENIEHGCHVPPEAA